jgi:hypothetical protein
MAVSTMTSLTYYVPSICEVVGPGIGQRGLARMATLSRGATPTPNPSPQGGGER